MATGATLKLAGEACATCPARGGKCVPPEPAALGATPKLAVVGEFPRGAELEHGHPLAGGGGRMLARGLKTIGLSRHDVHWTNAILCKPPFDAKGLASAAKHCAERLRRELASSGATAVVPLGPLGLKGILQPKNKPQLLKWRGSISEVRWPAGEGASGGVEGLQHRAFVLSTLDPGFVLRAPKWGPVLELDVARIGRVLENGFTPPEDAPHRKLVVPKSREALTAALGSLGPIVSGDVETVGLGPTATALVCLGFSDGTTTVVVPWSKANNGLESWWHFPDSVAAELSSFLAARTMVSHNGPAFDHIVMRRYGINIGAWDDTLLASHALAGHMPKNLAHVATQHLDVPPWKQFEDRNATLDRLWTYNGRDCLYTILTWFEMRKHMSL
jgi:uracil-DNA glycosylase family 4